MDDRDDINKYRKKRSLRKFRLRAGVLVLFILTAALVAINWNSLIAPLKDVGLNVGEGGFPVTLPGSTEYDMRNLGDNFCLLTDTYLYTYTGAGAQITDVQHGFQNPAADTNDKRILVYDRSGKDFRFFSKSAEIYSKTTLNDSIVFGAVGHNEHCALVTTSTRYTNVLYVFNGDGKQVFLWNSPDSKILQLEFSADDSRLYAAVVDALGGELRLSIKCFDLHSTTPELWTTYIGSSVTLSLSETENGLFCVTSGGAAMLDSETGDITAQTSFTKTVAEIPEYSGLYALSFADSGSNGEILTLYDDGLNAVSAVTLDKATAIKQSGKNLYVLSDNVLTAYDETLTAVHTFELDDVYSDMIIGDGCAYLLGYNVVQRIELYAH